MQNTNPPPDFIYPPGTWVLASQVYTGGEHIYLDMYGNVAAESLKNLSPVESAFYPIKVGAPTVSTPIVRQPTSTLFSRALLQDMTGGVAMVNLQPADSLKVQYTLRTHVPSNDLQGTLLVAGESYRWTSRAANALTPSTWSIGRITSESERVGIMYNATATAFAAPATLGPATGGLTGSAQSTLGAPVNKIYKVGSHQLAGSVVMGQSDANFVSGVGGFLVQSPYGGAFQVVFDKGIPKDNTQTLSFDFSIGWA
jgi:hypothetical protein